MMGRSCVYWRLKIFLYLFLDEEAFADGHFEGESDDKCIHFVELAVVRAVNHPVAEQFNSFAEVVIEGSVDYFLVAKCLH
jgi:hypothetical protein